MDSAGEFKRCTRCTTIVPADASFCGKCGAVVGTTCPHCQKAVDPKTEFCCYCGQTLASKNNTAAVGAAAAVLPSLPLDPPPAKKPDWTKGDAGIAPVVIIQPDRGSTSSRWYGGAAILCVIVAACVFWQWGMSQVARPAPQPPASPTITVRLNPDDIRRTVTADPNSTGYQPNQQPAYRYRLTPPSYNPAYRPQLPASGPMTSTAPVPAPAYRPATDPDVPPSIVIQHGMPAPAPAPAARNPEYDEIRRRVELERRSREAAARRSGQPDARTRPGAARGHWENGRWIVDGR